MFTRDFYIATLEKRAAEAAPADSVELASKQRDEIVTEDRSTLKGLFDTASNAQKDSTALASKLFPSKAKDVDKQSGNPMMKVARELFNRAWPHVEDGLIKTASPAYREVAFRSFYSELEKLARNQLQDLGVRQGVTQRLAANKVWDISGQKPPMPALAPAVQKMREKASRPGLLGQVLNRFRG